MSDHAELAIEVVNLSDFAVTITDVGLEVKDKQTIVDLNTTKDLPKRLQSRESFTVYYLPNSYKHEACADVVNAFANTACGTKVYGSTKALVHYIEKARKYRAAGKRIEDGPPSEA